MDRHLELLKLLVAEGNPGEISLSYNTNATVFPSQEVLSLWKQFRKVTVAVSVDGAGKLNEYIRFPSRWETVEQVTRRYAALAGEQENFHLSAICTVSAYNLHGIAGLMRWWKEMVGGSESLAQSPVTLNFVREPALMAANVLPAPLKLKACEQLQREFPEVAKRVRAFVLAKDRSDLLEQFVARTRKLDRIRGQSVAESIPELRSVFGEAKASAELSYQL
jgi:glutamate-1-semialdehyde 2,1-aminomutase